MKVSLIYISDFVICATIIVSSFYIDYQKQISLLQNNVRYLFEKALKEDLSIRLNESNLWYRVGYSNKVVDSLSGKGFEIASSKEGLIPYDNEIKRDFSDKGLDRVLQYALVDKCPITFEGIDSLFNKELKVKEIYGKRYIHIYRNGINISPLKEKIPAKPYVFTELQPLDIKKIVKIQVFVECEIWSIVGKMRKFHMIGLPVLFLFMLSLIWINRIVKLKREEAVIEWKKIGENKFKFGKVIVNQKLAKVINKELKCEVLLSLQPMSTLCMFLRSSDHYVKVEDIIKEAWPKSDKTEEQLIRSTTKLLSSIKSKLKGVIKIEFEKRGQGYLLVTERRPLKVIEWKEDGESLIGAFRFNVSKKHLRIRGLEIPLTSWQVQIIEMFLKASNHSIKKDKLHAIFKQEAENNKIDIEELVAEKMLGVTKLFIRDPDVKIIKDANSNYQLVIKK